MLFFRQKSVYTLTKANLTSKPFWASQIAIYIAQRLVIFPLQAIVGLIIAIVTFPFWAATAVGKALLSIFNPKTKTDFNKIMADFNKTLKADLAAREGAINTMVEESMAAAKAKSDELNAAYRAKMAAKVAAATATHEAALAEDKARDEESLERFNAAKAAQAAREIVQADETITITATHVEDAKEA